MSDHWKWRFTLSVPIRETLKEVDSNTWLIGPLILHRSSGHSDSATWFDDEENSSYTITDAPNPPPPATLLKPNQTPIVQIDDAGDVLAIWALGKKAVCKVFAIYPPDNMTPEDVTLKWVQDKRPNFNVPDIIHSCTHDDRLILIKTTLPGQNLGEVWPSLSMERKHYYVKAVADICKSMAEWKGDKISGIDGRNVADYWIKVDLYDRDNSPAALEKDATTLGMDCSSLHFIHPNLSPDVIFVDDERVGVADWIGAGYYPRGWVRTKFEIHPDMDLPEGADDDLGWYRRAVDKVLESYGFEGHQDELRANHDRQMRLHPRANHGE